MPSPSSSLATLRPDLGGSVEEFNLAADRAGFIGFDVLPVLDVAKPTGVFGRIPIEQLLQARNTRRAPRAGYDRGQFTFEPDSYVTYEEGAEEPVDDNEAEMYADYFDAELVSAERARDAVLRKIETDIANTVFNATTFTAHAVGTEWSTLSTATPIADVAAARKALWEATGIWADTLIINSLVLENLRRSADIVNNVKYAERSLSADISIDALKAAFNLDKIMVSGSPKNTAGVGAAVSIAPIWSNEYAMVCKTATTRDIKEPCLGRNFHWSADGSAIGGRMESYRDETIRGDVIRCRMQIGSKLIYPEAGYLLSNITA